MATDDRPVGDRLTDAFNHLLVTSPDSVALYEADTRRSFTYRQVGHIVAVLMRDWDARGMRESLIITGNAGIDTVVVFLAAHFSGRVPVMLDRDHMTPFGRKLVEGFTGEVIDPSVDVGRVEPVEQEMPSVLGRRFFGDVGAAFLTSGSTGEPRLFGVNRENRYSWWETLPQPTSHFTLLNLRRPSVLAWRVNVRWTIHVGGTFVGVARSDVSSTELDTFLNGISITATNVTRATFDSLIAPRQFRWPEFLELLNLSGDKISAQDLHRVAARCPRTSVRTSYGLTELGNVCEEFFSPEQLLETAEPVSVGKPATGIHVLIIDDNGSEVPVGEEGRIEVYGSSFGFLGNHVGDDRIEYSPLPRDGWVSTGDLGHVDAEGNVFVHGRYQETVKVRGTRLSLTDVEAEVRATGLVADVVAATYEADDGSGPAVGVVVVPNVGSDVTAANLRLSMTERVPLVMCPTRVHQVTEIPMLPAGKVDRRQAALMLDTNAGRQSPDGSRPSGLEGALMIVVGNVLGKESLGLDDDLFVAGLDSLLALEFVTQVEKHVGHRVDVGMLLQNPTLRLLAESLSMGTAVRDRVVRPAGTDGHQRVYWVLPGGNPYTVFPLVRSLANYDHRVIVQLGSLADDVVLGTVDQMVEVLRRALVADLDGADFVIASFSAACFLANELVARLTETGCCPRALVVIDPPDHANLVREQRDSGKVPHPVYSMLGREGRLERLDHFTRDVAMLGLQVYGIARHAPRLVDLPTFVAARSELSLRRQPWASATQSTRVVVEQPHLAFMRKPESISADLAAFLESVFPHDRVADGDREAESA